MSDELMRLPKEIDALDTQLVELLARRFALSRRIGELKHQHGAAPFDPERVNKQKHQFVEWSQGSGLDSAMATTLITAIIDQVIRERMVPPREQGAMSSATEAIAP